MRLKRRAFLQRLGAALAALECAEAGVSVLGDRYYRALAQPSRRKLALLVGVNQYPRMPLSGCVTDVELQRELLLHRFGFQASDILTLTDQQASRENLEAAFLSHLTEQATPGDLVVFHFSGYGGLVSLGTGLEEVQTSLVPVDGFVPDETSSTVNDVLEDTILLLLRSLQSSQVTTILDTSYAYPGDSLQGNLRVRARPSLTLEQSAPAEFTFQDQLLTRLNLSKEQLKVQRQSGKLPGVVLSATSMPVKLLLSPDTATTERAFEAQWNGFSAGLLTYALTQYLWQATPATTLRFSFRQVSATVHQLAGQEQKPALNGQKSQEQALAPYNLTLPEIGADGVVTAVEDNGKTIRLWLGGLPVPVLERYEPGSLLTLVATPANVAPSVPPQTLQVQLLSKDGLTAKARLCCTAEGISSNEGVVIQAGYLVQEEIRVLPRNLNLTVALDGSLERIERVDATSAFSAVPRVSVVIAGEQSADYLFGKAPIADTPPTQVAALPSATVPGIVPSNQASYGLFLPGRLAISTTIGEKGEAVKAAIRRLAPTLQVLLAAKLLNLTTNAGSSRLGVSASLELVTPEPRVLLQQTTLRSQQTEFPQEPIAKPVGMTPSTTGPSTNDGAVPTVAAGSQIRYRIHNTSDRPLYAILLGLENRGKAIVFYLEPNQHSSQEPETRPVLKQITIAPGETLTAPQPSTPLTWSVRGTAGFAETLLICSSAPFVQTFSTLEATLPSADEIQPIHPITNSLEVVQAVLQDLNQASGSSSAVNSSDNFSLNVNHWATLHFIYQVT